MKSGGLDKFSKQADLYRKYRPKYPLELYDEILRFVKKRDACWDCGTGNGQVATMVSGYFKKVYATDLSENQLANAKTHHNIYYKVERAENTGFDDNTFDLITVAQAIHWFDQKIFNQEVQRVAKNGGILSVWGYGLLRVDRPIDMLIDSFYHDIIGSYWDKERKYIDEGYKNIIFDFEQLNESKDRYMIVHWNLDHLEGYLNSWSSVQNYMVRNNGINPVHELIENLRPFWAGDQIKSIRFPIYLKVGKILK